MDSTDRTSVQGIASIPYARPEPVRAIVDVDVPSLGPGTMRLRVFPPGEAERARREAPPDAEVRECHGGYFVMVTSAGCPL